MGSLRFGGVRFSLYPVDHPPVHVHARYAGIKVVLELFPGRIVAISKRRKAVQPHNAKRSEVAKIVRIAEQYFDELMASWETMHP